MERRRMSRNLTRFPLEVVLRVVSHMNHYTIVTFLRAMDEYRKYASLVTDHKSVPVFFDLEGLVDRKYLPMMLYMDPTEMSRRCNQPVPEELLFSLEHASSHPIRLFDLVNEGEKYKWIDFLLEEEIDEFEESTWMEKSALNCTSFLYFEAFALTNSFERESSFLDRLEQQLGCKSHTGLSTLFQELDGDQASRALEKRWIYSGPKTPALLISGALDHPCALESGLVALRLHNVPVVSNLNLPCLVELSILYYEGAVTEVPVIENLIAPSILRFVVHYDKEVPRFIKMNRVGGRIFKWETKKSAREAVGPWYRPWRTAELSCTRYFELSHTDSIGNASGGVSTESTHRKPTKKQKSFSFLRRFHVFVISGVPWGIVKDMNFARARFLRLTVTNTAGSMGSDFVIGAPELESLRVMIKADDITLPYFTTPKLLHQSVRIGAFNPNIEGLWQEEVVRRFSFHIYSDTSLPLRASNTGKEMYFMDDEKYEELERFTARITLSGFPDII